MTMKRILTDDEHATRQFQNKDNTAAGDLAASIRAASMRARKTVTEGYRTSLPCTPLKQVPFALTGAAGYQLSARENNRQIFPSHSGAYSPLPSPSKRKRFHPDSHDDDDQHFIPQSLDRGLLAAELSTDDMVVDRPMKPLRRSGRIREMSPLPQACSLFRRETEMNPHQCEQSTNMHTAQLPSLESASDNEQQQTDADAYYF